MKTKIIILLIIVCNSFSYSQIIKSIGFKSGITLSNQNWQHSHVTYQYFFNTHAGLYNVFTFGFIDKEYWELNADFGFYQSSSKTEYNKYNYDITRLTPQIIPANAVVSIGFITFSPIVKLKKQIKSFTPYLFFGPRIDLYNSNLSSEYANRFNDQITKKPIWGFNFGEGISYNFKNISINLEYQFLYTFKNIINYPISDSTSFSKKIYEEKLKTSSHVFNIGLIFHF